MTALSVAWGEQLGIWAIALLAGLIILAVWAWATSCDDWGTRAVDRPDPDPYLSNLDRADGLPRKEMPQ